MPAHKQSRVILQQLKKAEQAGRFLEVRTLEQMLRDVVNRVQLDQVSYRLSEFSSGHIQHRVY